MAARYLLAPRAAQDITEILRHSEQEFGQRARKRYGLLLRTAMEDLAEEPERPGARERPELFAQARTYHVRLSRDHVPSPSRVKKPRHFLLFRVQPPGTVEIARVLHDSMELSRHLPPGYDDED
jgi:toxin ParE1/3/4